MFNTQTHNGLKIHNKQRYSLTKHFSFTEYPRGEGVYGERLPDLGEVDDITDDDDLNDSSQKPMLVNGKPSVSELPVNWRTNYSGSSSLSSFSYSPRSNNSSVSSHGKKLASPPRKSSSGGQNGSLRSCGSFPDKNSVDS